MNNNLDHKEIKEITENLKKLQPGFLPFDIFIQIARITALPIVEIIPYRRNMNDIEILLIDRNADDPIWPNKLHTPGTVIRPDDGEEYLEKAFSRIIHDELKDTSLARPQFINIFFNKSLRGSEVAHLYTAEVLDEPQVGSLYSINNLPNQLIESQKKIINIAINYFNDK